ncbi:chemotaxis protein CheB [Limnochorda pilosa]|uniref:protein-glutamate methylesterase n=1 Tax=Limnochorda pilosa TaxID=1555112 RepID=A0A0K2SFQ9_LIMPI|nr:CheB methylesterase domain-containing protein [Limnochorda pilosa]BAS25943.1 chemotaxis protein [Limnochorda pilosa]
MDLSPLVVIGASTGGPAAVESLLRLIPMPAPGAFIVVQHMPPNFTGALAARLDRVSALAVREARPGDRPEPGQALVAPGGFHLVLDGHGRVRLSQDPPVNFVRPALDVTLLSAAPRWGSRLVAVVLTGMGRDGTAGSLEVKRHGGMVLVQDPAEALIASMPEHVLASGAADRVLTVPEIARVLAERV